MLLSTIVVATHYIKNIDCDPHYYVLTRLKEACGIIRKNLPVLHLLHSWQIWFHNSGTVWFKISIKTRAVTLWWLRLQNDLAAVKYSEIKWPGPDPAEWPCLCWHQPFDTADREQDKSSVLLYTCLCVSDTLCDLVWWLRPPGTPRQLAGTGMWRRLKDLSHLEPSSSSSNASPQLPLCPCQSLTHHRWTITKPTVNPRPCEKNRRCAKLTRVKRDIFWLTIKALLSTQSHKMCKHRRVDWFRICTLELIFCNGCCGWEALVHLVVGVFFYVWTTAFLINCCFFLWVLLLTESNPFQAYCFPINDSQRHINCVASIKIKSTLSSLHTCLWLTYLLEWHLIQWLLSNFFSQGAMMICFLYQLLNKGWVSS